MTYKNIAIIGASGGVGAALVALLSADKSNLVYAFSRTEIKQQQTHVRYGHIDYADEQSIYHAAEFAAENQPLDWVIVATGFLHNEKIVPEKSMRELSMEKFEANFLVNTIGPALVAKHFIGKLRRDKYAVFSALSARVGSISDNQLGGWYAYRASKAALNMLIKSLSIEVARKQKKTVVVGLHPGTVDTPLSLPFQRRVAPEKLFNTEYAAANLVRVLNDLTPLDSGKVYAWDGSEIPC